METLTASEVEEGGKPRPKAALWRTIERRERWGLTWLGWMTVTVIGFAVGIAWCFSIYPFLAVTERVDAKFLVIEGWIPHYAAKAGVDEFRRGYLQVFSTGGPITGMGGYTNDYNTSASVGAGRLRAGGIAGDVIQMVPSRVSGSDRTFGAAQALRTWIEQNKIELHRVNVLTESTHARRSRLLFQKALGDKVQVGVIAVPNPDYDASHWWRYSDGVKDVLTETIAYVYVKVFFHRSEQVPAMEPER